MLPSGKANVVADALNCKNETETFRVRATRIDVSISVHDQIKGFQHQSLQPDMIKAERMSGKDSLLNVGKYGLLRFKDRVWVPTFGNLRMVILEEAHKYKYIVHPGSDKMYKDLRKNFWWP
jgi:hypothetical protein